MTETTNPFARGYQNLHVVRTLCIIHDNDWPPIWRALHPSQSHLPDNALERFPCIFNDTFVVVTEGQEVSSSLDDACQSEGSVHRVVYSVMAQDFDGRSLLVGDTPTETHAQEVLQRLRFDTGFFSRCWEISTSHLTEEAYDYLLKMALSKIPHGPMFDAFQIPGSSTVGVKLIGTPWSRTDQWRLECHGGLGWLPEYRGEVIPTALTDILDLAGQADVRMLVFDPDAPELDGLSTYDWP
ncbi:ABC transporter substrate-binding protein [Paraburkholderia agricolaris]|jgi:hypothetical protein|uniref:ABC transporter substrate-binding protein n=1 Tax=Paraburkholderia agricolaris TaxID=2152888 RepID=A0ABW8ZJ44_9BURK